MRQDRLAAFVPLVSVALFLLAMGASFWYLRMQEIQQEYEALVRDVDYAQQRLRLRLLERQDQLARLARDIGGGEMDEAMFANQADVLIARHPELAALSWLDERRRVVAAQLAPGLHAAPVRGQLWGEDDSATAQDFAHVSQSRQPVYRQELRPAPLDIGNTSEAMLHLQLPIISGGQFAGVLLAQYTPDGLWRYAIPSEVQASYAMSLLDAQGAVLAGVRSVPIQSGALIWGSAPARTSVYQSNVSLVGSALQLRGAMHGVPSKLIGRTLLWMVAALSVLTVWLILGTWRHTRRRLHAQQALVAETNLRRAMENSTPTGIRALDLRGRITYVNPAFCRMTGFSREELIGSLPPYPYWPDREHEHMHQLLEQQLQGRAMHHGLQFRLQRKDGTLFDGQLYVAPLIDAHGQHTGWMSSLSDVTETNRTRQELASAHDRFTIVLEALDAAVSVTALGSAQLLFANKLYREWFAMQSHGHLQMVEQAGLVRQNTPANDDSADDEDGLMGLPTDSVTSAQSRNVEIFLPELGRWLEVRARYLSWADGRLAQMVIATDITARRQAQEQAAQQAERAQTASRLITMGEMASSVAHELNQPLTAISNYCSGMLSRLDNGTLPEDKLREALQKTAHQAQRAAQVIGRIRDFVKRSEPHRAECHPHTMVDEALELVSIVLRRRSVRLEHHMEAALPTLLADRILIEQVLVNLIKNAAESIDSAQRPSDQRRVYLRVYRSEHAGRAGISFAVTDTGTGLPEQMQRNLFTAFFSTKPEGMGIGLNLCRSIVESHTGHMSAHNLHDDTGVCTGCCFSFWLPLTTQPT